ncbi:MAG: metal ABC transporter solute-binding protein, Zn/Mn family [Alphaproteobacteria bacterium]
MSDPLVRLSLISLIFSLFAGLATASAEGLELRTTTRMLSDPLGYLFEGQAEVSSLLGAGTDPHTYQPTRKDVRSLIEADAVAFHGLLFEAQLLDLMKQLDRRLVVVGAEAFQDDSDLLFAEGVEDPHTWHTPVFWIDTVLDVAAAIASDLDIAVTAERVEILKDAAARADTWIAEQLDQIPTDQRVIVSAHDAFQYYGQRYGVDFQPLLGLSTASETKLSRVNELVDLIVERDLSAVFSETSVETAGIAALREGAERRGVALRSLPPLYSDALGPKGSAGSTYFGMLLENTQNMVDAMTGQRPDVDPELLTFLSDHGLIDMEASQ